jgi:hypothetical protein
MSGSVGAWWSTLEIVPGQLTRFKWAGDWCTRWQPGQHQLMTSDKSLDKVALTGSLVDELIGLLYEDVVD